MQKTVDRVQMSALLGYVSRRAYGVTSLELCIWVVSLAFMKVIFAVTRSNFGGVHKFA